MHDRMIAACVEPAGAPSVPRRWPLAAMPLDAETEAVLAEMTLEDAREVCDEQTLPWGAAEPLAALQARVRAHMTAAAEAPPAAQRPSPPPRPAGGGDAAAAGTSNASSWLKKENTALLGENKRLRRDMDALSRAAGGEVDIEQLRKKLAAVSAVVAERDELKARVAELEARLAEVEDGQDDRFLSLVESQEKMRQACQQQLDEARRLSSGWQQRYGELEADHKALTSAHAQAQASSTALSSSQDLARQHSQDRRRGQEDAARAAAAAEARQRIEAAEAASAEAERRYSTLQMKVTAAGIGHQRALTTLSAQLQQEQTKRAQYVCRSCQSLLDELGAYGGAGGYAQQMLLQADRDHQDQIRVHQRQIAELDHKVLELEAQLLEVDAKAKERRVAGLPPPRATPVTGQVLGSGGRPGLGELTSMGFEAVDAHAALDAQQGDVRRAVDWLFSGNRATAQPAQLGAMPAYGGPRPAPAAMAAPPTDPPPPQYAPPPPQYTQPPPQHAAPVGPPPGGPPPGWNAGRSGVGAPPAGRDPGRGW